MITVYFSQDHTAENIEAAKYFIESKIRNDPSFNGLKVEFAVDDCGWIDGPGSDAPEVERLFYIASEIAAGNLD